MYEFFDNDDKLPQKYNAIRGKISNLLKKDVIVS